MTIKQIFSWAVTVAIAFLAIAVPTTMYLSSQIDVSPLHSDNAHGFSYALNSHGVIHYVTWQNHIIDIALSCMIGFSVPVLLGFGLWVIFISRR